MDDVIENCQTTFEEDGVNQQTLEDLKSVGISLSFIPALLRCQLFTIFSYDLILSVMIEAVKSVFTQDSIISCFGGRKDSFCTTWQPGRKLWGWVAVLGGHSAFDSFLRGPPTK